MERLIMMIYHFKLTGQTHLPDIRPYFKEEHSEPGILQDTKNIRNDNSIEKRFWQMQVILEFHQRSFIFKQLE